MTATSEELPDGAGVPGAASDGIGVCMAPKRAKQLRKRWKRGDAAMRTTLT